MFPVDPLFARRPVWLLLVLLLSVFCAPLQVSARQVSTLAQQSGAVEYRDLPPNRPARDCAPPAEPAAAVGAGAAAAVDAGPAAAAADVCRVRVPWTAVQVRDMLERGAVHRDGDHLTFVHETAADSVELNGGLEYPLGRVAGTDLWVVTVRVPGADRALISYFFVPYVNGDMAAMSFRPAQWRGPAAPASPAQAAALQGTLFHDTLASALLRRPRGVSVYVPPERGSEPIAAVVYVGDNGAPGLAAAVDTLITQGLLPRIMLVGIEADRRRPGDAADGVDRRITEYLYVPGQDTTTFLAHEKFLLEVVLPWAESRFGAPATPAARAIAGFSNSAAFALDMGLRHPDVFAGVISLSPAGRNARVLPGTRLDNAARFYLAAGTLEKPFHDKARAWADVFARSDVPYLLREPVAGHDWAMWSSHFLEALSWLFPERAY